MNNIPKRNMVCMKIKIFHIMTTFHIIMYKSFTRTSKGFNGIKFIFFHFDLLTTLKLLKWLFFEAINQHERKIYLNYRYSFSSMNTILSDRMPIKISYWLNHICFSIKFNLKYLCYNYMLCYLYYYIIKYNI